MSLLPYDCIYEITKFMEKDELNKFLETYPGLKAYIEYYGYTYDDEIYISEDDKCTFDKNVKHVLLFSKELTKISDMYPNMISLKIDLHYYEEKEIDLSIFKYLTIINLINYKDKIIIYPKFIHTLILEPITENDIIPNLPIQLEKLVYYGSFVELCRDYWSSLKETSKNLNFTNLINLKELIINGAYSMSSSQISNSVVKLVLVNLAFKIDAPFINKLESLESYNSYIETNIHLICCKKFTIKNDKIDMKLISDTFMNIRTDESFEIMSQVDKLIYRKQGDVKFLEEIKEVYIESDIDYLESLRFIKSNKIKRIISFDVISLDKQINRLLELKNIVKTS